MAQYLVKTELNTYRVGGGDEIVILKLAEIVLICMEMNSFI